MSAAGSPEKGLFTRAVIGTGPASSAGVPFKIALIVVATLLALYFRRPDQFFHPYIWVEDGTVSLPQYIEHGWLYLFEPVAGYLILPSKLIQASALTLSVAHYPEIALALTVLFHAGVLCAIALSPTTLKFPLLCALFTLVLPTDSEVFGTSLYAFWWGSLLILPPLLWTRQHDRILWPRIGMMLLGGLSSPLVIALLPVLLLRNLVFRTRNSTIVTCVAILCAIVQLYFLRSSGTHGTDLPSSIDVLEVIRKFFGMFVYWSPQTDASIPWISLFLGCSLLTGLLAAAFVARRQLGWRHGALVLAMLASIAISVARVPPEVFHPILAGPRYFFYPYIFLGWLIIELIALIPRRGAVVLTLGLGGALHQFVAYGPRGHHAIDWEMHMTACEASSEPYSLPVHFAGNAADAWVATLPAGACMKLQDRSLLK